MAKSGYAVEMIGITKSFGNFKANDNITLRLKKGEIHALLGENGAGKSTLMSILFGLYQPDSGEIRINGEKVSIKNPNDANEFGIGMVHQHFKLVDCFTILDNIILGAEDKKHGLIDRKSAKNKIIELSKNYGLVADPDKLIENVTVGMQQRTEILKMLYRDNDILIFDEPTAVLTPSETKELLQIMKKLASDGCSILFISHKMNEIMSVADRCTVIRKGRNIDTVDINSTTKEELSRMMVGRKINTSLCKKDIKAGKNLMSVTNLTVGSKHGKKNKVDNVSFEVKSGEIVCIAGIDGNGQSELIHALTGLIPMKSGKVELCGEDITNMSIRKKNLKGLSHIPEDRHLHGLVLDYSIEDNMILQRYFTPQFKNKAGFLKRGNIKKYTEELVKKFDIRSAGSTDTAVRSLSGGNQQKLIIVREMECDPKVLIAVQPTRGLDIGAIEYIHKRLVDRRNNGGGILLVSFELDEVMNLADRILVMFDGKIVGELDPKNTTVEELGLYMSGARRDKTENE